MKTNVSDAGLAPDVPKLLAVGTDPGPGKLTPRKTKARAKTGSGKWLIAGLLFLSAIPMVAGGRRLTELTGGAQITPSNVRFFASPLPVMLHIVGASLFSLLGAFQFSTAFRRHRPGWHRIAGRLVAPAGLLVGLSALWMTLFYPRPVGDGDLLSAFRLLFGSAMIVCIVLGITSIMRRDVKRHRAWMVRAYAIGLGAGTQALVLMVGEIFAGKPGELSRALLMGAAWVINLSLAEWAIRKRSGRTVRTSPAVVSQLQ